MTHAEILNRFEDEFPHVKIDDYRPICHELFTDDKQGVTIWLGNGDIIEYYPKGGREKQEAYIQEYGAISDENGEIVRQILMERSE